MGTGGLKNVVPGGEGLTSFSGCVSDYMNLAGATNYTVSLCFFTAKMTPLALQEKYYILSVPTVVYR